MMNPHSSSFHHPARSIESGETLGVKITGYTCKWFKWSCFRVPSYLSVCRPHRRRLSHHLNNECKQRMQCVMCHVSTDGSLIARVHVYHDQSISNIIATSQKTPCSLHSSPTLFYTSQLSKMSCDSMACKVIEFHRMAAL